MRAARDEPLDPPEQRATSQPSADLTVTSAVSVAEAAVPPQARQAEPAARAHALPEHHVTCEPEASKPKKRPRYASTPGTGVAVVLKQDPSRAAPLPTTVTLEAKNGKATFSTDSFADLPIDKYLRAQLQKMQLTRMTPVQQQAIPRILGGKNMLIRSPTGSGKTLAYAVPGIQAVLNMGTHHSARAAGTFLVVLVPTRELCFQSHEVIDKLCHPFPWLVCSTLMGGERRKAEKVVSTVLSRIMLGMSVELTRAPLHVKARLRKGAAIVVGTPGRVLDHLSATRSWLVADCRQLVLDEADRLLDLV